jgi:hypothetical protein
MKNLSKIAVLFCFPLLLSAQRPWQEITVPSLNEVAANFKAPPHEYGAIQPFLSWNGPDANERKARIVQDLDRLAANGVFVFNMSPGRGEPMYLSPQHMEQVKFVVQEAAKRGMKLWLQDECDYPSGFAGGKMIKEYPQLCMQGIVADIRIRVAPGQRLAVPVSSDTLAIMALETAQDQSLHAVIPIPLPPDGQLKWTVPAEGSTPNEPRYSWEVLFVRHIYISSPTRASNREDGTRAKDGLYSLIDYLDPDATRAFLKVTHETYLKAVGDDFGKTVLGFFGDEPDYSIAGSPWTPQLLEKFQQQKGYDLKPYIPQFFAGPLSDKARRAKADYWDVWSGIFGNTFFKVQAEWCARNHVEYLVHLNHEETMTALVRSEGDFFRDMRHVGVPGIDNLSQLIPGAVHTPDGTWNINNNFPKLASSAAHLFGRPKVWTESAGGPGLEGKYAMDFQLVRGVNALQIRVPGGRGGESLVPPQSAMLAWYADRAGYLMAIGRPAAQVALYFPSSSLWMGDDEANRSMVKLGWQLLERQVDWDYFDDQSLTSVATLEGGAFKNLSGQLYRAIVIPSMSVIPQAALARLQAFAKTGGKVVFVGNTPKLVVDKTFMEAKDAPDLSFATLIEPAGDITPQVIAALPKPDVKLDAEFPRLTYLHRSWRDAEMYFFFNESNKEESRIATVAGRGQAQAWDLTTGEIHPLSGATAEGDFVRVPLVLEPYEAKLIVVGPLPAGVSAGEPALNSATSLLELAGDWAVDLNGQQLTTPLRSWEDLGSSSFSGPATYRKQFAAPAVPAGKRVFLEIADVRDYARVKLNGKELPAYAWQPYRWDVTGVLKTGDNDLEIVVNATSSGRGGGGGPPPSPAVGGRKGPGAPTPPAGGGRGRGGVPPVSGLIGPVRFVTR